MSAFVHRSPFGRVYPVFGIWLASATWAFCATVLTVNEVELVDSKSGTVPVGFRSDANVAAMQMDVLFDPAGYTSSAATPGTLPANFRVDSFLAEPGRLRVVVGAPANATIADATAFNVPITAVNEFSSAYPVVLTNFIFSTAGSTPVAGQLAPRVRLLNLANGDTVNAKGGLQLSVEAGATDSTVARVEFYFGDQKIGESTGAPFGIVWNPPGSGNFVLRAIAYDSNGLQTSSRSIPVVVFFNSAPTVRAVQLSATENRPVTISLAKLLAFARDADGDALSITVTNSSTTKGGTVSRNGNQVSYTPPTDFTGADVFTFTISDGRETTTGTVNITIVASNGNSLNMVLFTRTANGFLLKFAGIPGASYIIQYRNTLNASDPWTTLNPGVPLKAGPNGLFEYEDKPDPIPPTRFYRAAEAP